MKPNTIVTIFFAIITIALFAMCFAQMRTKEEFKNKLHGALATDKRPAIISIEEAELKPKREEINALLIDIAKVKKDFLEKNREAATLQHKLTVYRLTQQKTEYYKDKWQAESVLFTDNRKNTEESKKATLVKFQAQIDTLNSEIARDSASYEEQKKLISDQRKTLVDKVPLIEDHMNKEKNFKETIIARTRDDLKKNALKSASTYKMAPINGEILVADSINNTAVISIGKKDGVRRGMKFDIIRENSNKDIAIKGQFRVNEITDTTALGFIIDLTETTNPILVGDKIGNPMFIKYKEAITTGEIINEKVGPNQILINRGSSHNIMFGQEFEVYAENQGFDRIVKAKCKATTINENTTICTLFDVVKTNIYKEDKIGTKIDRDLVKTFFLAGDFKKKYADKAQIKAKIEGFGHVVVETLTPTTNYLVEGTEGADSFVKTAQEINITVMQEDDLLRYLD
jgi:hypothetical protein